MILKSIFGLLLGILSNKVAESVPVTPRWHHPCQRSESYGSLPLVNISPVIIPIGTAINNLYEKAAICRDKMKTLKDLYINGGLITNRGIITELEQKTSFMPALNLPRISFENVTSNISGILNSDYKSLSTIAIFLEDIIEDEEHYEHSEHVDYLNPADTSLYGLMCEIRIIIYTVVNSTLAEENISSRDVMSDEFRSIGNERHKVYFRDFVIIHKSLTYLRYLVEKYTYLKNRHSYL